MDKRGGGAVSRFSVENFLSHSVEFFRRGILYCCINFGAEKVWRRGRVSRFSVENFLSRSAENFRRESFTVALISSIEKVWIRGGGGGIKVFRRKFSVSECRKFSWGILYCCINFGCRKSLGQKGGVSRFSVKIVLSHNTKKLRRGTIWCFRKFLVSKFFMLQRVMSRFSIFCQNFFCLAVPKFFADELFCAVFQKSSGSKKV